MVQHNYNGEIVSPQPNRFGDMDISTEDFILDPDKPKSFMIKNENDDDVLLDVVPSYDGINGEPVTTKFSPGWNPERVIRVKQETGITNIKWGI